MIIHPGSNPGAILWPLSMAIYVFSYGMRNDKLHGRRRKLDAIKETGKSSLQAIERCKNQSDWTKDERATWSRTWTVFDKKTSDFFVSRAWLAKQR